MDNDARDAREVRIALRALEDVEASAREAAPAECCGLLLGQGHEIQDSVRIKNLATNSSRYLLDPSEHISARRLARTRGLDVVGFYHSHPHTSAEPSATDLAEASYPGLYLIVSVKDNKTDARIFHLEGSSFRELTLVPSPEPLVPSP